jgi:hypothetical protein
MIFDHNVIFEMNIYCIIEGSLKKKLYLLSLLSIFFFQVDHLVQKERFRLKTNAQYKFAIVLKKLL